MRRGIKPNPSSRANHLVNFQSKSPQKEPFVENNNNKLKGILRLLEGQLGKEPTTSDSSASTVSLYRYHGETLRTSQSQLQKRKRRRRKHKGFDQRSHDEEDPELLHSSVLLPFEKLVRKHRFVAILVVQGWRSSNGSVVENDGHHRYNNYHYSSHTLNLRWLLAKEYHDAMSTFVLDLSHREDHDEYTKKILVDEYANDSFPIFDKNHEFCKGTGFGLLVPHNLAAVSTLSTILGVTKVPSLVVIDSQTGRKLSKDALLAMEQNDPHVVINRWQAGNSSGLTWGQTLCCVLTCRSEEVSCCTIQ